MEGDEPIHTVEQEQCKFAFSIIVIPLSKLKVHWNYKKFSLYSAVDQKDTTTMHHLYNKSNKSTTFVVTVNWHTNEAVHYMKLNIELKM